MTEEIEIFATQVRELYKEIIINRIERGRTLFDLFEQAVLLCSTNEDADHRQLTERTNELAVAKVLLDDRNITGKIEYEPNLLPDNRKIDFVVTRDDDKLYIEVKTVHPRTADTEEAWDNYVRRSEHHPENAKFIVNADWMGGAIYGDIYASRQHFLEYSLAFESRLAQAKAISGGPGILVFCGNGFSWDISNLEDFVDYYQHGNHRQDDPFALMEQRHIDEMDVQILRNIDHFAYLKRPETLPEKTKLVFPVRGPRLFGPSHTD